MSTAEKVLAERLPKRAESDALYRLRARCGLCHANELPADLPQAPGERFVVGLR